MCQCPSGVKMNTNHHHHHHQSLRCGMLFRGCTKNLSTSRRIESIASISIWLSVGSESSVHSSEAGSKHHRHHHQCQCPCSGGSSKGPGSWEAGAGRTFREQVVPLALVVEEVSDVAELRVQVLRGVRFVHRA